MTQITYYNDSKKAFDIVDSQDRKAILQSIALASSSHVYDIVYAMNDDFKDDKKIIKKAMKRNAQILELATQRLRMDQELALLCADKLHDWYLSVDRSLRSDKDFMLKVIKKRKDHFRFALNLENDAEFLKTVITCTDGTSVYSYPNINKYPQLKALAKVLRSNKHYD